MSHKYWKDRQLSASLTGRRFAVLVVNVKQFVFDPGDLLGCLFPASACKAYFL